MAERRKPRQRTGSVAESLKVRQLLAERDPDVPKWQFALATTLYYTARCENLGAPERAQHLQRALDILNRLETEGAQLPSLPVLRAAMQALNSPAQ